MSVGVVIQARMASTRLPGKVLCNIAGRPLIGHVLGRLAELSHPVRLVVATSSESVDDEIARYCTEHGVRCFRGSEEDVLGRYLACTEANGFDHVVRLTADNPFTDMTELDRLIDLHLHDGNDYTHAFGALPVGVGAEIFTRDALTRSAREGQAPNHREHVNEYIEEHRERFKIGRLEIPATKVAPELRLTVDTPLDYARACSLAALAAGPWLSTEEAIRLCSRSA